ncbi:hypothetical protein [Clostridium vitabionis]|uniref:hypothetical protein n=1 Tax=Clostridium vitabionis TaxID=2784388 RepID=UPI00188A698B|nr:hypothetical protein [Clostridium vitabionis]
MNKERNREAAKMPAMIMVPEPRLKQLVVSMTRLAEMHLGLIELYEEESRLKKQHKPYLYLREHADQVCENDKKAVESILHTVLDFDDMAEEKTNQEPDPEECHDGGRHGNSETYFMDNFNLPGELVLMTTGTLGTMQDDMLQLTDALDYMVALLRSGVAGIPIRKADAEEAVKRGEVLSEEVFKRWDDAEIIALG